MRRLPARLAADGVQVAWLEREQHIAHADRPARLAERERRDQISGGRRRVDVRRNPCAPLLSLTQRPALLAQLVRVPD